MKLVPLAAFVTTHHDEIIDRCRGKVVARSLLPAPAIEHGVPAFLDQLVAALHDGRVSNPEIGRTALLHGRDLLHQGVPVSQVVHHYGDVCQSITEVAVETGTIISADDFRTLNRCLDAAIAGAVTEYDRDPRRDGGPAAIDRGNDRLGLLARELRTSMHTAIIAFQAIRSGNAGIGGSTGTVLLRSLIGLDALIGRSLAEVRLGHGIERREHLLMSGFIHELVPSATLAAVARGLALTIVPIHDGVAVEADRHVLSAVVGDLLQNAFTFTHPGTTVTLRVEASDERVRIEIQDESGGAADAQGDDLLARVPPRDSDGADSSPGLMFSRLGAEANGGRLYAHNVPDKGCVFTLDLPRVRTRTLDPA